MIARPSLTITPALRIAAAAAALSLVADLALLARGLRGTPERPVVALRLLPAPDISPRRPDDAASLDSARAREPFARLDAAPAVADASVVVPQAEPVAVQQPKLIGTVVRGEDSFVVMALPDGAVKVVRVGERAGNLRLRSVTAGSAVFDDINGGRVTLRSPTPGAEPHS